jgi:succinate dehydrogenase / fumarate reductase, cytochrome b subunit
MNIKLTPTKTKFHHLLEMSKFTKTLKTEQNDQYRSWLTFFQSSIGKKSVVAITGLLMGMFLIIHLGINIAIFYNDGGITFDRISNTLGHGIFVRSIEVGLLIIFAIHIYQSLSIEWQNNSNRGQIFNRVVSKQEGKWYSRSMHWLGIIVLSFLLLHLYQFWWVDLIGLNKETELYTLMKQAFSQGWVVIIYLISCLALSYHLQHGLQSAVTTLGLMHDRYRTMITSLSYGSAIFIPLMLASVPVAMYFNWVK